MISHLGKKITIANKLLCIDHFAQIIDINTSQMCVVIYQQKGVGNMLYKNCIKRTMSCISSILFPKTNFSKKY